MVDLSTNKTDSPFGEQKKGHASSVDRHALLSNIATSRAPGWQRKWNSSSRGRSYLTQRNSLLSYDFNGVYLQ